MEVAVLAVFTSLVVVGVFFNADMMRAVSLTGGDLRLDIDMDIGITVIRISAMVRMVVRMSSQVLLRVGV